jgi:hypothetical protein
MSLTIDEIRQRCAPINERLELLRDKLSDVQGEIEGERARLRSIQMRCSHPNKLR